jgi:plasmid maintenance system antidote protein VapI
LRLAKAFGTSPEFWLNGQLALDLYRVINDKQETAEVEKIEPVPH